MNIPECSVSEVVEQLMLLCGGALCAHIPFRQMPAVFLWGPPGIGKSDAARQFAVRLSAKSGKRVVVTDVRLLLFSPVDLRGVPVADAERKFADWLRPRVFEMDPSEEIINLLFLDELSAAPQSVQAAAYQLTLDRRIGEHALPENCIVIAAGNRTTDQSVAYKMPKALANRMMHYNVVSDFQSWKAWAQRSGIDSRIIGYLSFDNSRLCAEPSSSDLAYPTPRSWSLVDRVLKAAGDLPTDSAAMHMAISACVGKDVAIEFQTWCSVYDYLPTVEDIRRGVCTDYPKTQDALYALSASLTEAVLSDGDELSFTELDNICAYAARFPPDFALAFFQDLNRYEAVKLRLMQCRSLQAWMARNKRWL